MPPKKDTSISNKDSKTNDSKTNNSKSNNSKIKSKSNDSKMKTKTNDKSTNNTESKSKKGAKRKYVRIDDYEEEMENQRKKYKELQDRFESVLTKQKKYFDNRFKKQSEQISRNTDDIEELYDNYEEGNDYKEDNSFSNNKMLPPFDDNTGTHIEVIPNNSDFGKKLMSILTGAMDKGSDTRLNADIAKIMDELNIDKSLEANIRVKCKAYSTACKELKLNFSQEELKHFIAENDEYKDSIISNLQELISKKVVSKEPYILKVMKSKMEPYTKQVILNKVNQLNNMEPGMGDYYKLKRWVDTAVGMPWGKYKKIDVPQQEIANYLTNGRKILDKVIYGQEESKDIMIQIISKLITNTNSGNVFSLYGPAGVGKTTIIKNGLAKALDLPFAFISLGGATDASYLDGHSYTYEGSVAGKIVDIITKSGCMNPIIYFDELDKVSNTAKGREIMNMLIHLTDPVQSSMFQDKYLGSIDIDLSKCIFVFSFNNIEKVNRILLDRMKLIYVKGFTVDEKMVISRDYLLPELLSDYNLYYRDNGETNWTSSICNKKPILELTKKNLKFIINYGLSNGNHFMTSEEGVRQIKQRLEKICSLINIVKITSGKWKGSIHSVLDKIPELKTYTDVTKYPIKLSNETIGQMLEIKNLDDSSEPPFGMYS